MRNTESFLLMDAGFMFATVAILGLLHVESVDVYVALFVSEFFLASELAGPFTPVESRRKMLVGILLLAVFGAIVARRVLAAVSLS